MKTHLTTLVCLYLINSIRASPFELTEAYVKNFREGLHDLKEASKIYKHEEQSSVVVEDHEKGIADAKEYDFIIIGGGTSGAVIANRLSEVPEWKVLLLEAGSPETEITQVPGIHPHLQTTSYDWGHVTIPQNHSCLGFEEHRCPIPAGKALGGNTAVNNMIFTRGNPDDYDIWADLDLKGWCWKDVLPYFKKLEDAHVPDLDRKLHNLGGPVHVENFQHFSTLQRHFLEAGHEVGLKTVDVNGKEQIGLGVPQAITKNGKRNSVTKSYLNAASKRANLKIYPKSQVLQILISPHTKEAYGVKFLHNDQVVYAKAAKEVVLAAGGIDSPKLLLLSGVGPKEELEHQGVAPLVDLKVGHNLKDHLAFLGLNFVLNSTHLEEDEKYDSVVDYLKNGKGPLTNPNIDVIGFLKTEVSKNKHHGQPDVELVLTRDIYTHLQPPRVSKAIHEAVWAPLEKSEGFTIQVILLHPKSTGALSLHDKDPLHRPLVNTEALTDVDEHDVETILAGIHEALKLAGAEPLRKLGVHLNPHKIPGCDKLEKEDEYWKCAIRHLCVNVGDVTGTVKMGTEKDKEAVVDEKLRVFGVKKLRVADASVVPVTISGQMTAPVIMIGERAADLIKEDWK